MWVKWINLILGILVIIAPWVTGTAGNLFAMLANVILGVLMVVFGFILEMVSGNKETAKAAKS